MRTEANVVDAKILIVDDNVDNVAIAQEVLGLTGYRFVEGMSDSALAIGACQNQAFDLIVLDLQMSPIGGYEFLNLLRVRGAPNEKTPVLIFTAELNDQIRDRAQSLGANGFLTKPFDAAELATTIRRLLID